MVSVLRTRRVGRIESYAFPPPLVSKLTERDPAVSHSCAEAAVEELREWFVARAEHTHLPPPTGLADVAWREFILMTKKYREFCERGFGGYVHYPPG